MFDHGGHAIVAGVNYGQGSSREHAALAPRYLGLRVALVKDFARIHWQNLVNFGVLPITFVNEGDYDQLSEGDVLVFSDLRQKIKQGKQFYVKVKGKDQDIAVQHALSPRQVEIILMGGLINWVKNRKKEDGMII